MSIKGYSIESTNEMQPEIDRFNAAIGKALNTYLWDSGLDLVILFDGKSNKLSLNFFEKDGDVVYSVESPISKLLSHSQSEIEYDAEYVYQMLQNEGLA